MFDDACRRVPDMPTRAELQEREAQMRDRSSQLLGYAPGSDPAAELRALRVPTEGRVELLDEIADVLRTTGHRGDRRRRRPPRVPGFVAQQAGGPRRRRHPAAASAAFRRHRTAPPPSARAGPAGTAPTAAVESARVARRRGVGAATVRADRALEQLDTDLAAIDAVYNADLTRARSGGPVPGRRGAARRVPRRDLLGGQLPFVLDGALDGLGAAAREAAVKVFAGADDLQTIVVSDDVEVMQSLARPGAHSCAGPGARGEPAAAKLQPAPTPGA